MSSSTSPLKVASADPTAQISVYNGSADMVASGIGSLDQPLEDGLYKIRVRVGSETEERLVPLDDTLPLQQFDRIEIPSPIPLNHTGMSHEYHQALIDEAWANRAPPLGAGGQLLIVAREWSLDGTRAHPDPAAGLAIVAPSGKKTAFADIAKVRNEGDACAAAVVDVDPGYYRLELAYADGRRLRRALHVSAGWSTQLYMLFQDDGGQRLPNLGAGSVAIAQAPVIHDEEARLAEIALDALTQHREILSDHMRMLLSGKFQLPMLGLIGAHLLLRDETAGPAFQTVVNNLAGMLGPDHPDVAALSTKLADAAAAKISEPPMLRASWDLLVEASSHSPDLIAADSPAARVAELVVPGSAWLTWQPAAGKDEESPIESKLQVVRAYVEAQAQSSRSPPPPGDALESLAAAAAPAADLGEESRADLSRALGMPRGTLDGLLKQL